MLHPRSSACSQRPSWLAGEIGGQFEALLDELRSSRLKHVLEAGAINTSDLSLILASLRGLRWLQGRNRLKLS